ncbi:MAG: hypothetical protein NZ480_07860 [Bdellovibrionaceae bacterium]|nr:hypothetical protein [Pseudobdellovibrionaceae bacterium]MDW8189497.1 formyltransferase family protein [Pseudobdellovibrionaceae bacterium]
MTSDIHYVPNNYENVTRLLWERFPDNWVGVFFVRSPRALLIKKLLGLVLVRGWGLAGTIINNFARYYFLKRDLYHILQKLKVNVFSDVSVNTTAAKEWLRQLKPDLILHLRSRCIFDSEVLKIPALGSVNVHHGLLPYQVGAMCDLHALSLNEDTGFSIHLMTDELDRGPIYHVERVDPPGSFPYHYIAYLEESAKKEAEVLLDWLTRLEKTGSLPSGQENSAGRTKQLYCKTPHLKEMWRLRKKVHF